MAAAGADTDPAAAAPSISTCAHWFVAGPRSWLPILAPFVLSLAAPDVLRVHVCHVSVMRLVSWVWIWAWEECDLSIGSRGGLFAWWHGELFGFWSGVSHDQDVNHAFCKHEFGGVQIVATIPITYRHNGFAFPASKKKYKSEEK